MHRAKVREGVCAESVGSIYQSSGPLIRDIEEAASRIQLDGFDSSLKEQSRKKVN